VLGREVELARIEACVDRARGGSGSVTVVHGELGIGKTRLLEEVAALVSSKGGLVASGNWYESAHVPAYVGFLEAFQHILAGHADAFRDSLDLQSPHVRELARLGPDIARSISLDLAGLPADNQEPYGLWRGVLLLLEAACSITTPVVLVLDDAQWADDGSLDLLAYLGRNVRSLPLGVVIGHRDEPERLAGSALDTLAARLPAGDVEDIALAGLGWKEVQQLAAETANAPVDNAAAELLCEYTNGNPLFVQELMRRVAPGLDGTGLRREQVAKAMHEELPSTIRTFMEQRFEALSPETQYLLQLAACFGRTFDLLLIEEIADVEGPALSTILEEGCSSGVISETEPGRFTFTHPLMREVTYAAIAPANRIAIHERVASALERHYGPVASRHAREIASHLISAGGLADPAKVVRYCKMGAREARSLFASHEMAPLAEAALRALEGIPLHLPRLRANLLLDQSYALTMLGRPDEALAGYQEALRISRGLGDEEGVVDCQRWIATTLLRFGRWDEASAMTAPALEQLPVRRSHPYIALAGAHALAALVDGRFDEAGNWSEKLLDLAFDDETAAIAHHAAAGVTSWGTGDPALANEHFEACRDSFLRTARDGTAAGVAADQTVALYLLGQVERSRVVFGECVELAERANRVTALTELNAYSAVLHTHEGRWERAEEAAEHWRAASEEMGGSTIYGQLVERAETTRRLWQDGPDAARQTLQTSSPLRNEPLLAELFVEEREHEQAKAIIDVITQMLPPDGRGLFWLSIALPLASVMVTLRDERVAAWVPALERYAGALFDWHSVDIELGRAHAFLEDWERSESSFARAHDTLASCGLRSLAGVAQLHHGITLLERRDRRHRARGLASVRLARALFSELGMGYVEGKAEALLPKSDEARPAGLSAREWEVLQLLGGGRTNREISDELVVSPRTVEFHLQNIYGKLGVSSRAAAIAWLASRDS